MSHIDIFDDYQTKETTSLTTFFFISAALLTATTIAKFLYDRYQDTENTETNRSNPNTCNQETQTTQPMTAESICSQGTQTTPMTAESKETQTPKRTLLFLPRLYPNPIRSFMQPVAKHHRDRQLIQTNMTTENTEGEHNLSSPNTQQRLPTPPNGERRFGFGSSRTGSFSNVASHTTSLEDLDDHLDPKAPKTPPNSNNNISNDEQQERGSRLFETAVAALSTEPHHPEQETKSWVSAIKLWPFGN